MATFKNPVVARVEQMIRVPAPAVFSAFTEPKELKKFWLSKASAPLEERSLSNAFQGSRR